MKSSRYIINLLLSFVLLFLLGECESEFPWKIKSKPVGSIVLDAIITNELKSQLVIATLPNENFNLPPVPVSGLIISVTDSLNEYDFIESSKDAGHYYSAPFRALVGKRYLITVINKSKIYQAETNMVPITPMDTFSLVKDERSNLYKFIPIFGSEPAMMEVLLDWSSDSSYCTVYGHCQAEETFYRLNNIDENKVFGPEQEVIYFPTGTKIVRHKYSLSEEHQAFLRSLLMETQWRGGLFDVQPGNVKSNFNNGALGFFGACMVLTDSILVK